MLTIEMYFQDEFGRVIGGELVNPYKVIEAGPRLAVEIDQIGDEIDVIVFEGDEMQVHRITMDQIVRADEVLV